MRIVEFVTDDKYMQRILASQHAGPRAAHTTAQGDGEPDVRRVR